MIPEMKKGRRRFSCAQSFLLFFPPSSPLSLHISSHGKKHAISLYPPGLPPSRLNCSRYGRDIFGPGILQSNHARSPASSPGSLKRARLRQPRLFYLNIPRLSLLSACSQVLTKQHEVVRRMASESSGRAARTRCRHWPWRTKARRLELPQSWLYRSSDVRPLCSA